MKLTVLKPPFPYWGGKSRVAHIVWEQFGNPRHYIEPFAGSLAVLLGRPLAGQLPAGYLEYANDLDGYVVNFFRAVKYSPEETLQHASDHVRESDIHARHIWLVNNRDELWRQLEGDPSYHNAQIAGWWVWGISNWMGRGWCDGRGSWNTLNGSATVIRELPGVWRQRPHLGHSMGIQRLVESGEALTYINALTNRLKDVRITCGSWERILNNITIPHSALTVGVFLDPPYGEEATRKHALYNADSESMSGDILAWCIENGSRENVKIALCGYTGELHDALKDYGWTSFRWSSNSGYAGASKNDTIGKTNRHREVIWFSPNCRKEEPQKLGIDIA